MGNETKVTGKPKLWTSNFIAICLVNFSIYIIFYGFAPTLPIYIETSGGSSAMNGLAMGALTLAAVVSRPVTGWALDKYGRRMIIIGGLLLFLIPSAIYIMMIPVLALVFFRFIQGLGWGVANTSTWTVASDIVPPARLGEGMGIFGVTLSLAMALAPALTLWLMNRYSFQVMFLACALILAFGFVLSLVIKYPQIEKPAEQMQPVFIERSVLRPAAVILFFGLSHSAQLSFIALHAIRQGLPSAGLYFTVLAVSTFTLRPLSGMIIDRKGEKGYDVVVLIGCIALLASVFILARITTLFQLALGGALFGFGFGFVQPTTLAQCLKLVPASRRGAATATYWAAMDVGVGCGSIVWGVVSSLLGYCVMFNLALIPIVIALIIYFARRKGGSGSDFR